MTFTIVQLLEAKSIRFLPDYDAPIRKEELRQKMHDALLTLKPREQKVLEMRFGLGDEEPLSLADIAEKFAIGRSRVFQIEATALRKLRHPSRSRNLREFCA